MIISIIAIIKWLLFALSGGALYRGFSHGADSDALPAKIAGGVTALLTMVAFASDATGIFAGDEISKAEQLFWESVEKHPSEKLYRDYLEKYPNGQFKDIALTQAANYGKESPVATIEQPAPAVVKTETPPVFAMAEKPVATATVETPAIPEKVEQPVAAPVELAQAVPTVEPVDEWKTIDHYQVKGGLVKDSKTGLMWMRCSMGQSWDGSTCQGNSMNFKWQQAMRTPIDFSYENYSDWRVPTLDELKTLVYCSSGKMLTDDGRSVPFNDSQFTNGCDNDRSKPAIVENVFPQTPTSTWSSSSNEKNYPLIINFNFGAKQSDSMDGGNFVRLVRSEKKPPASATIDNYEVKDGLVKDTKTGLMWMRCSMGQSWDGSMCQGSPKQYYWDDIKKTANFNYENYNDWRVPTLKELQTIVYCSSGKPKIWDDIHNQCEGDYAKPTIMSDVFPQTPSSWEFMSSSLVKFYWGSTPAIVNFINGQSHAIEDANHPIPHVVRLVRSEKNTPIAETQQTTPPANTTETPPAAAIESAPNNQQAPDNKVQKDKELAKAQSEIDEANKRINIVWNATTKANRLAILPEQREWLKKRENDCTLKASTEEASDKTVQETIKLHCMAAMTDPRTEELKQKIASMI